MTYRVVKIEPCKTGPDETGPDGLLRLCALPDDFDGMVPFTVCDGCNGDGTRMVDVAEVERPEFADGKCVPGDDGRPEWMPWDDRPISRVWVEVES